MTSGPTPSLPDGERVVRAGVELAIADVGVARHHRDGVWRGRPGANSSGTVADGTARAVSFQSEEVRHSSGEQNVDPADGLLRRGQPGRAGAAVGRHRLDLAGRTSPAGSHGQPQFGPGRATGSADSARSWPAHRDRRPGACRQLRAVDRVVLEHDQRVEQFAGPASAGSRSGRDADAPSPRLLALQRPAARRAWPGGSRTRSGRVLMNSPPWSPRRRSRAAGPTR